MKKLLGLLTALIGLGFGIAAAAEPTLSQPAAPPAPTAAAAQPSVAPLGLIKRSFDAPGDAGKYQYMFGAPGSGAYFAGGVIHWSYNDANRPAAITQASALAQIQASMAKWHAAGCNVTFVYDGTTSNGLDVNDGVNVVGWALSTGANDPALPYTTNSGVTGVTYDWSDGTHLIDADMKLNASFQVAYTSGFDSTVTHEAGHMLGLNHSDVSGQVMSGPPLTSYNGMSTLQSDDIAGCVSLYGSTGGGPLGPDVTAPTVPTGLAASSITTTTFTLSWNASTDPAVNGATTSGMANYKVYSNGSLLGTVTSTGATVNGVTPGSTNSFTVSACDAASNCSAQSAPLSVTMVSADTQPPTVPTGLTATGVSTSQINLAWFASTDNVGVTGYNVYQGGALLGTVTGTTASVTNLAAGTPYTFTVSACDAAGNCSAQSAPASANTQPASQPTCTAAKPPDEQQTLACPAGQTGLITQRRTYSCVGTTWTPGAWQTTTNTCTTSTTPPPPPYYTDGNFQDIWWAGTSESGWGITVTQHGDALFLAWFLYDSAGNPMWIVLPTGAWNAAHTIYSGNLYIPSGSPFSAYDTSRFVANAPVGTASIQFTGATTATLSYTVRGVSGTKSLTREPIGTANAAPITNYGDMWWGGTSQSGWGIVLSQQYHDIFAAWYTYDANGQTTWFTLPVGTWTTPTTYTGAIYRTRGAAVLGVPYNPASFTASPAGTITFTFTDANTGTMTYTVDGVTQTKPITRIPF